MRTSIITLLLALFAFGQVQAQKIYSTKTATVRFIAVDDKDIDATNTKAVSRLEANGKLSFIMLMKDRHTWPCKYDTILITPFCRPM